MYWVSYVKSTLKGGCDTILGKKVILYGRNGAGKSTIVQSIELALTGQVTDMEGRKSVKQAGALARLFPSTGPLFSEAVVTDGTHDYVFRWEMERKKDGFKSPEHQCPLPVRFPIQDMEAILQGDAKAVGAWLETQVSAKLSLDEVLNLVVPTFRSAAETFMRRHGKTDLLVLSKLAADEARTLKLGATKSRKAADNITAGVNPPLIASQLKALEAEKESLQSLRVNVGNMTLEEQNKLKDTLAQCEAKLQTLQSVKLPLVDPKTTQLVQSLQTIKSMISTQIEKFGTKECKVCGNTEKNSITNQMGKIEVAEKAVKSKMDSMRLADEHNAKIAQLGVLLDGIRDKLNNSVVGGIDAHVESRIRELDKKLNDDMAARKIWASVARTQAEASQEEAEANQLSLLGKEFKRIGEVLLVQNKSTLEAKVNAYMPPGEFVSVDLETSRIGLLRDHQIHSALSGAEENRVLLALCAAQEKGSTPCVMIPKDRAWDPSTLHNVMVSTVNAPVQILIMSTVEPKDVSGWSICSL